MVFQQRYARGVVVRNWVRYTVTNNIVSAFVGRYDMKNCKTSWKCNLTPSILDLQAEIL